MRPDLVGLWWQDAPPAAGRAERAQRTERSRPLAPIPDTGWRPPTEFPNLTHVDVLAIDTETNDPNLEDRGPGWGRHDGNIAGFSVATADASWYFPLRHAVGDNHDNPDTCLQWARDTFKQQRTYLFANALYDLGWLREEAIVVNGTARDVQAVEVLLNEDCNGVALDKIATRRGFEGKSDASLNQWCADSYGGPATRKGQAKNYHRAPACLVGPYAEQDARVLFPIYAQQQRDPLWSELQPLIELEHDLIPMLLEMRWRGVRVDLEAAHRLYDKWSQERQQSSLPIWSADELAILAERKGLVYERTEQGSPSFVAAWLEKHWPEVHRLRKLDKMCNTFIQSYIFDSHVNGRLHCQFHPLRFDEYGAISGRFASSNPNLQNIPVRDEEFGPPLRALFIPEEGHEWVRYDYSQVEFRLLTHFGRGVGAEAARQQYRDDPTTDFHNMVSKLTGVDRKPAKNINFGFVYGMGKDHLAEVMGKTRNETDDLFDKYHAALPFVKETYDMASKRAANRGYVVTLLGRRALFNDIDQYTDKWGNEKQRRDFTHKALNRVLQGSAADIIKLAMRDIWRRWPELACHLQVHDELDFSMPVADPRAEAVRAVMQGATTLTVPLLCDMGRGASWGSCA